MDLLDLNLFASKRRGSAGQAKEEGGREGAVGRHLNQRNIFRFHFRLKTKVKLSLPQGGMRGEGGKEGRGGKGIMPSDWEKCSQVDERAEGNL